QIAALLQTASAEAGASVAARCQGCHDLSEANTNRVGPGLYGIVGHVIASHEGFSYSAALSALGEAGEEWDYAHLDAFLTSPQGFAPGTTMAFPGIANAEDRADLIAYLRELSDDPLPLPEAPAEGEAAPAEEAPAEAVEAEAAEDAAPAEEVAPVEEEAPAAEEPADEPAAAEDEAAAAEDAPVAAAAASGYVTEAQV